jgi:hypothetical protein
MYNSAGTIRDALLKIERDEYVLPAIQREFVWEPDQIEMLFDSLMQGYPFGTFLFWRVEPKTSKLFKFFKFVLHYHQRDNAHCEELPLTEPRLLTAVLDGQQRLTALNIGLRGSMARKLPNRWWNNDSAFPKKLLHLDVLATSGDEERGSLFEFRFIEPRRAKEDPGRLWFRVGDILEMSKGTTLLKWVLNRGLSDEQVEEAHGRLDQLRHVVHDKPFVHYFEETEQDIDRVLNIFIRLNSGGTPLSYSDLLLSIAVAQWAKLDARQEIHECVDELNRIGSGFAFSKDFVLKAGLMLADIASVGFKVANFNHENMARLEAVWPDIRRALKEAVDVVASFGFSGYTLRADSAVLPIAYYLYRIDAPDDFDHANRYKADRERIRYWFTRTLLKPGIWGSGLDTALTYIRATIAEHYAQGFPAEEIMRIMAQRGKALGFEAEEIEDLADLTYDDKRTFLVLSLLYPFIDLRHQFHVDDVYPRSHFTPARIRREGIEGEHAERLRDKAERLANLQLLEGFVNKEKRAERLQAWLERSAPDEVTRQHLCDRYDLGLVPGDIHAFEAFYDARRSRLRERLSAIVNRPIATAEIAA